MTGAVWNERGCLIFQLIVVVQLSQKSTPPRNFQSLRCWYFVWNRGGVPHLAGQRYQLYRCPALIEKLSP